jgi:glycosyltransferase involved in cell wall biosynthesis
VNPKVSIIVPIWNEENFLEESLESIRTQTFENFEVIMVDDCSIDRSKKIMNSYETIDPRFKSTKTDKNSGTGTALNAGFALAKGEYQTWLSGDSSYSSVF